MKKIVLLFLLTLSMQSYAGENVWRYLRSLTRDVENLQNQINGLRNQINQPKVSPHKIGDLYQGGIVFWLDSTGEHGLIASNTDLNKGQGIQWRNGASGNRVTNAKGDGIGSGETNTRIIISQQTIDNQKGSFAALQASNFQVLADGLTPCKTPIAKDSICYGGWYLPSAFELQLMHSNLHQANLSSFAPEYYWSSTEADVANAWMIDFATGELVASNKANTLGQVRAIAHF